MKNLPPLVPDPVIEAYKKDVDVTLLREGLRQSVEERFASLQEMAKFRDEMRRAMKDAKAAR